MYGQARGVPGHSLVQAGAGRGCWSWRVVGVLGRGHRKGQDPTQARPVLQAVCRR